MTAEAFIDIRAEFPAKLRPLFQPRRYKVMHGGRGGGKSWAVARALLTAMEFLGTLELVAGGVLETQRSHSAIFAHTNLE